MFFCATYTSNFYLTVACRNRKFVFNRRKSVSIRVFTITCIERRLEPLFERDSSGGRRLVAPRPANRLFSNDGDRAQINAWNEDTVNTPNLFNVFLVGRDTWANNDCG